jgi:exodeoxyribonuclease V gamma subunit
VRTRAHPHRYGGASVEEEPRVFVVHRAAEGAALAAGLARCWTPPSDPFAGDVVAVPAKGVERWLAQRLSHVLGSGTTGATGSAPTSASRR